MCESASVRGFAIHVDARNGALLRETADFVLAFDYEEDAEEWVEDWAGKNRLSIVAVTARRSHVVRADCLNLKEPE